MPPCRSWKRRPPRSNPCTTQMNQGRSSDRPFFLLGQFGFFGWSEVELRGAGELSFRLIALTRVDLLPVMPPFMGRVCSGYAPQWGVLQTPSV